MTLPFLLRLEISLLHGGKKNFNKRSDVLREQSAHFLSVVKEVRDYLETNRLLTSDNNTILLDLEEKLTKEIRVYSFKL